MHGRRRITTDSRNPTMPGRSTSGFHQPGGGVSKRERDGKGEGFSRTEAAAAAAAAYESSSNHHNNTDDSKKKRMLNDGIQTS